MVVVSSRNSTPLLSLVGGLVKGITDPLSYLFQQYIAEKDLGSADGAIWQRVAVKKFTADGSFYKFIDADKKTTCHDAVFEYVVHNPSGTLYMDETQFVVAFKCAIIAFANPVFTCVKMVWYATRMFVEIALIINEQLKQLPFLCSQPDGGVSLRDICEVALQEITCSIKENIWRVASAPIYALGLELCAIAGVVFPYESRAAIARLESLSQNNKGFNDFSCCLDKVLSGEITSAPDLVSSLAMKEVCFLALCFQPRGSLLDEKKFHMLKKMPIRFV